MKTAAIWKLWGLSTRVLAYCKVVALQTEIKMQKNPGLVRLSCHVFEISDLFWLQGKKKNQSGSLIVFKTARVTGLVYKSNLMDG